jgi:hypothetical protein
LLALRLIAASSNPRFTPKVFSSEVPSSSFTSIVGCLFLNAERMLMIGHAGNASSIPNLTSPVLSFRAERISVAALRR